MLLTLAGVAAAGQPVAWPSAMEGIEFLWENGAESNAVPSGGPVDRLCRLVPTGEATFNSFWAMSVAGGSFAAEPAMNADLLAAVRAAGAFAFELVVTPERTDYAEAASFAVFGPMVLAQRGERLLVGDGAQFAQLGTVTAGIPIHIVVNVASSTAAYVDGRLAALPGLRFDPASGSHADLAFGGAAWQGDLEGIAIYRRALGADEVSANHRVWQSRIRARTAPPRLEARARLVRKRDIPRAAAYPDSLVVFDYRVQDLLQGTYDAEKLLVAHYGNLNGIRRRATADLRVGRVYRLALEPFEAHPQLASLNRVSNEDDMHLPVFFSVADPVAD